MEKLTYDKLLLKTAFCCIASDGHIDFKEIEIIKSLCENSNLFVNFNFIEEINFLVNQINADSNKFIQNYLNELKAFELSEKEELLVLDFAIKTIKADDDIQYSEIKFFKNIRQKLNISNEKILQSFPDIEEYLENDINSERFINQLVLPKFDILSSESDLLKDIFENEDGPN